MPPHSARCSALDRPFSYAALPPVTREWLRGVAGQVVGFVYRTVCDYVRIGLLVAEARDRLKPRTFARWVRDELPCTRGWAYKLMAVGEAFAPHVSPGETQRIDTEALCLLAHPLVPAAARTLALEQAADGKRVTAADAREILGACRPEAMPAAKDVRRYELEAKAAGRTDAPAPAADQTGGAAAWAALAALTREGATVHLAPVAEGSDDAEPLYSATVTRPGERPRCEVRRTLAGAVTAAAGAEPLIVCPGCADRFPGGRPAGFFGANRGLPGGRNRECKGCARERLGGLKARKRADRAAKAAEVQAHAPGGFVPAVVFSFSAARLGT